MVCPVTQHPRATELKALIKQAEAAGKTVYAVEIEWEADRPRWTLVMTAPPTKARKASEAVDWSG